MPGSLQPASPRTPAKELVWWESSATSRRFALETGAETRSPAGSRRSGGGGVRGPRGDGTGRPTWLKCSGAGCGAPSAGPAPSRRSRRPSCAADRLPLAPNTRSTSSLKASPGPAAAPPRPAAARSSSRSPASARPGAILGGGARGRAGRSGIDAQGRAGQASAPIRVSGGTGRPSSSAAFGSRAAGDLRGIEVAVRRGVGRER